MDGSSRIRGVYEVDPAGPHGEQLLIAVDSAGRMRRYLLAHPGDHDAGLTTLWRYLDAVDPPARRPRLQAI